MDKIEQYKLTPTLDNIRQSTLIWWKNLEKFIGVYLWALAYALVPLALLGIIWGLNAWLGQGMDLNLFSKLILWFISFVAFLAVLYFSMRAVIGTFLLVKNNYSGDALSIFKETKNYFWPFLGLSLLSSVLIILWTLLLIIPGIIYSVLYAFAAYIFFFEGHKGMEAIRRSSSLAGGYWWPLFGRFLAGTVVLVIFMMLISWPMTFFAEGSAPYLIWNVLVQIISFLIGPISLLYSYHLYQDLRKIKEQKNNLPNNPVAPQSSSKISNT